MGGSRLLEADELVGRTPPKRWASTQRPAASGLAPSGFVSYSRAQSVRGDRDKHASVHTCRPTHARRGEEGLRSVGIALEDALAHHAAASPPREQQQYRKYQAGGPDDHQDQAQRCQRNTRNSGRHRIAQDRANCNQKYRCSNAHVSLVPRRRQSKPRATAPSSSRYARPAGEFTNMLGWGMDGSH